MICKQCKRDLPDVCEHGLCTKCEQAVKRNEPSGVTLAIPVSYGLLAALDRLIAVAAKNGKKASREEALIVYALTGAAVRLVAETVGDVKLETFGEPR